MHVRGKKPRDKAYPKGVMTTGNAIRARRLDLGLKQKDVAGMIGCDQTSVLNWEKGHNTPGTNKMAGVARFLGVHFRAGTSRVDGDLSKTKRE